MASTNYEERFQTSLVDLCQGNIDTKNLKNMSYDGIVSDVFRLCGNSLGGSVVRDIILTVDLTNSDDEELSDNAANPLEEHVAPCPYRHWDDMNIPYISQLNCDDSRFDFLANFLKINYFPDQMSTETTNETSNEMTNGMENNTLLDANTEPTSPAEPDIPDEGENSTTDDLLRSVSERLSEVNDQRISSDDDICIIDEIIVNRDWRETLSHIKAEPQSPMPNFSPQIVSQIGDFATTVIKSEMVDVKHNVAVISSSHLSPATVDNNSVAIKSDTREQGNEINSYLASQLPMPFPRFEIETNHVPEKPVENKNDVDEIDELEGIKQELQLHLGAPSSSPSLNPVDNSAINENLKHEFQPASPNDDGLEVEFEAVIDNIKIDQKFNFDTDNYDNDGFVKLPSSFSFDVDEDTQPTVQQAIDEDFTQDVPTDWHDVAPELNQPLPSAMWNDEDSSSRASPLSFQPAEIVATPPLDQPVRKTFANIFETFSRAPASPARTELVDDDYLSLYGDETEFNDEITDEYLTAVDINEESSSAPAKNTVFVSDNPDENKDNNDPEWQVMQRLKTDDERYRVVRMRWKNLFPPDPNTNLTTHNYWKRRLQREGKVVINVHGKRLMNNDGGGGSKRMRPCTEVYDKQILECDKAMGDEKKKLKAGFRKIKWQLELELKRQKCKLDRTYTTEREKSGCDLSQLQQFMVEKSGRLQLEYKYTSDKLEEIHRRNMEDVRKKYVWLMERVKSVRDEVFTFQKFYSGLKNSSTANVDTTMLSEERFGEMNEAEAMYRDYESKYV